MLLWQISLFDRLVVKNWKIVRQNLCMNADTNELTWRKVNYF